MGSLVTMRAFLGTKNLHDNFITLLGVSIWLKRTKQGTILSETYLNLTSNISITTLFSPHFLIRVAWILRSHWHSPKMFGSPGSRVTRSHRKSQARRGAAFGQGCEALRIKDLTVVDQTERRMGSPSEVPLFCKRMYIFILYYLNIWNIYI